MQHTSNMIFNRMKPYFCYPDLNLISKLAHIEHICVNCSQFCSYLFLQRFQIIRPSIAVINNFDLMCGKQWDHYRSSIPCLQCVLIHRIFTFQLQIIVLKTLKLLLDW